MCRFTTAHFHSNPSSELFSNALVYIFNQLIPRSAHGRPIPPGYASKTEGMATILQKGNEVFYNPAQVVNRDLSIAVLSYFSQQRTEELAKNGGGSYSKKRATRGGVPFNNQHDGLHILEGLAASGLRSIRYAKEIEGVSRVVANDMDPTVVDAMRRNIEFNGPEVVEKVIPSVGDARIVMMQNQNAFDVVDLDPYGSPSQLLDSAVQSVADGGLLCVTATDMAVLCGNNGEACYAKYGSYPLHKPYCHEMAVRIVLASIATAAARAKRYIVPVISCSIDFYVRMFVRVYDSAAETKNTATKLGYVYQSQGCDSFYWQRVGRKIIKGNSLRYSPGSGPPVGETCPETNAGFTIGGPYWAEPIHDVQWAKGILAYVRSKKESFAAFDKIQGLLTMCIEEIPDAPLYLNLHDICKTLRSTPMRHETFRSALINAGYKVSGTHCTPLGIKTNAPWSAIWDILRCWVIEHPVRITPGSSAEAILAKAPELKADFSRAPSAVQYKGKGKAKVARYPLNPEANWGPKMKHGRPSKKVVEGEEGNGEEEKKNDSERKEEAEAATAAVEGSDTVAEQQPESANAK